MGIFCEKVVIFCWETAPVLYFSVFFLLVRISTPFCQNHFQGHSFKLVLLYHVWHTLFLKIKTLKVALVLLQVLQKFSLKSDSANSEQI